MYLTIDLVHVVITTICSYMHAKCVLLFVIKSCFYLNEFIMLLIINTCACIQFTVHVHVIKYIYVRSLLMYVLNLNGYIIHLHVRTHVSSNICMYMYYFYSGHLYNKDTSIIRTPL